MNVKEKIGREKKNKRKPENKKKINKKSVHHTNRCSYISCKESKAFS